MQAGFVLLGDPGWLTTADVARRLGTSQRQVERWICRPVRGLKARRYEGAYFIREMDFDAFRVQLRAEVQRRCNEAMQRIDQAGRR